MIVGTAGHIDHGKTALVRALTGVDTDRLAEEKRRGITIDLGFAYRTLGGGQTLGFVDVPGHERFVHNMLAGAWGIDFVLLAVAADDGPMPQTVEHLQIVDLLGIAEGLVALTKADLAAPERLAAVAGEIRALLAGTCLAGADIVPVSSVTGRGVAEIAARLAAAARQTRARGEAGVFRLAVDRAFTLPGTGTVVTGTVAAGRARTGDALLVSPAGLEVRLRGIHAQNAPADTARAGQRCALNLVGPRFDRESVARGDWIVAPAAHAPTARLDARFRHLAGGDRPLRHWSPVHVHLGAAHVGGRLALLESEALPPGEEGWVQLVLDRPLGALHGDRFILRDQSARRTLGGGQVVDPFPPARGRRRPERLAVLAAEREAAPAPALRRRLALPPHRVDLRRFCLARNLAVEEVLGLRQELEMVVAGDFAFAAPSWELLRRQAIATLTDFHLKHPDLPGLQAERLRLALPGRPEAGVAALVLDSLVRARAIVPEGPWYRLPQHSISLSPADQRLWMAIEAMLRQARFCPPRTRDIGKLLHLPETQTRQLLKRLARMGKVIEVAHDHFFLREAVAEMAARAAAVAAQGRDGSFSAAAFRDNIAIGRKVAIQILEFFDRHGVTIRRDDLRKVHAKRMTMFGTPGGP